MSSSHNGHLANRIRSTRTRTLSPTSSNEVLHQQARVNIAEAHFWKVVDRLTLVCSQRPQSIRGSAYARTIRLCSSEGEECRPTCLPDGQYALIRAQDVRDLEELLLRSRTLHNLIWRLGSADCADMDPVREHGIEVFWFRSLRFIVQPPEARIVEISVADIAAILRRCHQETVSGHYMRPCSGRVRWLLRGDDTEVWPECILCWRLEPLGEERLRAAVDAQRRTDEDEVWDRYRQLHAPNQTPSPPHPSGPRRSPRVLRHRGRADARVGGQEGVEQEGVEQQDGRPRFPFLDSTAGDSSDSPYSWEPSDRSNHSRDASEGRVCQSHAVLRTVVHRVVIQTPIRRIASQRAIIESVEPSQSYEDDGEDVSPLSEGEEGSAGHHSRVSPESDSD
ncbi:hypothetical protein M406DRAFT_329454 [Cryphonectria parasitica EP155]|uniref:Uncharacterized protein n=1 Tax=Cryphonectria parasitica (strain ATCC 38755 / EP155) TaxID=660469 RepID=A0A9P5CPL8_CRYP1|nr:uncharacterized protein M406DRAFT_329454 [Cryphonectria parasitica EP155]KAF3765557.1 hypothetical protein M406DRAFT_329454 [Cryphonectria parasitica EP155]